MKSIFISFRLLLFIFLLSTINLIRAQDISTIAGSGTTGGFAGDGGAATSALLYNPREIAIDKEGVIYIADLFNYRIRKIATDGTISTIAGTGTAGSGGDGGPALSAQLNFPSNLTLDASGNLYVVENVGHRVRKITPGGIISTFAGTGTAGFSGDGGLAVSAKINSPSGVATDSHGNVYISDYYNSRIRKVDVNGIISTYAGTTSAGYSGDEQAATLAQLNYPFAIATDPFDNLYIADFNNAAIRKVTTDGIIHTIAGTGIDGYSGDGGLATSAKLYRPSDVTADANGNVYISDNGNNVVRKINANGIINTVAGNGTNGFSGDGAAATSAQFHSPRGLAVDGSWNLLIADELNNRIRKVTFCNPPAAPWVTTSAAALTICSESTASIQVTNTGTIGWYSTPYEGQYLGGTATFQTPVLNTSTTYYVQDSTCAKSVMRTPVEITVNQLPTVSFPTIGNVCNDGPAFVLTDGSPSGGTYTGTGVSSGSFDPFGLAAGSYTLTYSYTDANNCTNAATSDVNVSVCTGVLNGKFSKSLEVFPNPTSGILNINGELQKKETGWMTIYNSEGRIVLRNYLSDVSEIQLKLDLSEFSKGLYYMNIITESGTMEAQTIYLN